jgi:sigma-B regulation protein RsbU (phosphoserine phosphatase)
MRKELEMCRQIQEEMLPRSPLRLPFAEIRGLSIAAREVGGDFFNYFTLADNKVAILIGDVSGKGVPAALLMANLQATLRARLPLENDLAKLATDLDLEIHHQTPPEAYLTLFMAVLDPATKILTWVNAGHDTQFALQKGGGLQRLSSTGRPLGLLPGGGFVTRQLELGEGDALFLYTDGLVDCVNRQDEVFGLERLESVVTDGWAADSDTILARVETATLQHRQGHEPADDATMMVLRIGVFMTSDGESQN